MAYSDSNCYLLPSHPTIFSSDPLSTCEDADPFPTVWAVFEASVAAFRTHTYSLEHLPDLIQDLTYSIHLNGKADVGFLRRFIKKKYRNPDSPGVKAILDRIIISAMSLPKLFPSHTIPFLSADKPKLQLSRLQVRSLVAHQLLCTLSPPAHNTWGCTLLSWYSNHQAMKDGVKGYLETIFHYFQQSSSVSETPVIYEFCPVPLPPPTIASAWLSSDARVFERLFIEPINPSTAAFPHSSLTCTLVSSHPAPGFGSSCTQEELVTAACPELLPLGALCISPPVPADAAVIARGIIPRSSWRGHGRESHVSGLLYEDDEHLFVLLDAAELDLADRNSASGLPDLLPQYLHRDLHKAYAGFSSISARGITAVNTPMWGTGAFCGDPVVKTLILALIGALTGINIWLQVDATKELTPRINASVTSPSVNMLSLLQTLQSHCAGLTVQELWTELNTEAARTCLDGSELVRLLLLRNP